MLKVNNGTEHKLSKAMTAGEWNALALVYAENDTEGTVAVYLNGEEVLPATGIGFKLSEKSGIVGAVGATFGTGFMRTGLYDELVVTGAADAEAAKVETAARKAAAMRLSRWTALSPSPVRRSSRPPRMSTAGPIRGSAC